MSFLRKQQSRRDGLLFHAGFSLSWECPSGPLTRLRLRLSRPLPPGERWGWIPAYAGMTPGGPARGEASGFIRLKCYASFPVSPEGCGAGPLVSHFGDPAMNATGLEGSFAQQLFDWGIREAERLYPAQMAQPIHTVGILGAGVTGSRIAGLVRQAGWNLVVVDVHQEALARLARQFGPPFCPPSMGLPEASELSLGRRAENCQAQPNSVDLPKNLPRTIFSRELTALAECDFVLECVPENLYIKQQVFQQVEPLLPPQTILATNTSTIPLARLAEGLQHPVRFCGLHFFMPIPYRPVVEVVRGSASSAQTLATAVRLVRRLGMTPLVVDDGPGFLANRLLLAWLNEALQLLEEGYRPQQIDRQAQQFGWAMGPFALMDWIGLDVVLAGAWQLAELFGDRLVRSAVLANMVKKRQLGRKTGLGFYRYPFLDSEANCAPNDRLLPNPDLLIPGSQGLGTFSSGTQAGFRNPQGGPPTEGRVAGGARHPAPAGTAQWIGPRDISGPGTSGPSTPAGGQLFQSGQSGDSPAPPTNGIVEFPSSDGTMGKATCLDRLHGAILVEVEQMLQEGYVQDPRQVDLALVGGLGFPAHQGGLLAWADRIGLDQLLPRIHACPTAFRNHSAYRRLWERAHTHRTYYRPQQPK